MEVYVASRHLHIINEQSEKFTFHNRGGSSKIDLTITNNLIADVREWEISEKEIYSDHAFLKYKIGKANCYLNNYQCIRYTIKDKKHYEYDRKLEKEIQKFSKISSTKY